MFCVLHTSKRKALRCNNCKLWVHKKYSGVKESLSNVYLTFISENVQRAIGKL